jgi:anti-sigma B factor antagonist
MKVSSRRMGQIAIIDIEGKILLGDGDVEVKEVVDDLIRKDHKQIILNLAKVPHVDSAGLGEIIRCFTALRKHQGTLKLLAPNQRLLDLLTMTKLAAVFDWYKDEASAIASFSSKA